MHPICLPSHFEYLLHTDHLNPDDKRSIFETVHNQSVLFHRFTPFIQGGKIPYSLRYGNLAIFLYSSCNIQNHLFPIFTESICSSFFAFQSVFFLIPRSSASSAILPVPLIHSLRSLLKILSHFGSFALVHHQTISPLH